MIKRFFKDSVVYGVGHIFSRAIAFVLIPFYTRALSPSDYGVMDMIMMFASIACTLVPMEISQAFSRFYSGTESVSEKRDYATIMLLFSLTMYGVFGVVTFSMSDPLSFRLTGSAEAVSAFQVGVLYTIVMGIFYLIQTQLRWKLQSVYYSAISLLAALLVSLLSALFVLGFDMGVVGLLWGGVLGYSIGIIAGLPGIVHDYKLGFDWRKLREMMAYSSPLLIMQIGLLTTNFFDRWAIRSLMSLDDVGVYGVGYRFASIIQIIFIGLQSSISPLILTYYRESSTPAEIAKIFRIFSTFALCFLLFLGIYAREIVALTTAPGYHQAYQCIFPLALMMIFYAFDVFSPGIEISKKTRIRAILCVMGAVLNIGLNYLLIPLLGIAGASIASMLAALAVLIGSISVSQKLYFVPYAFGKSAAALVIVCGVVLSFEINPWDIPAWLLITMKSVVALLGCLGLFVWLWSQDERATLLNRLRIRRTSS
jgi:O-antigen/teichoic acid export membrane protein